MPSRQGMLARGPPAWTRNGREGRVAAPGPQGLTIGRPPHHPGNGLPVELGVRGRCPRGNARTPAGRAACPWLLSSPDGRVSSQEPRRPRCGGRGLLVWPLCPPHRTRDSPAHPSRDQLTGGATVLAGAAGQQGGGPWMPGHGLGPQAAVPLRVKGTDTSPASGLSARTELHF